MKTKIIGVVLFWCWAWQGFTQSEPSTTSSAVIEGGKVVVELIRAIGGKKEMERNPGCKNSHADFCILNESAGTISVTLQHRLNGESREIIVLPAGRECFLQARIGVWTYDLKVQGSTVSIRKGDILIEACNNVEMKIK